ncbi:hypothetical protein NLI96_g8618 [Meripilus lineatus]|uniref:Uncharacterized protein n=1 Tax=Meripilus lineatus TaxID=2056292 RepID=A0AAD5UX21_9APHY|nr:hypothetical protein NLI96_g8618 [Physisporinus lineatus]
MAYKSLSLLHLGFLIFSLVYPTCSAPTLSGELMSLGRRDDAHPAVPVHDLTNPPPMDKSNADIRALLTKPNAPQVPVVPAEIPSAPPTPVTPANLAQNPIKPPDLPVDKINNELPVSAPPLPAPSLVPSVEKETEQEANDDAEDPSPETPATTVEPSALANAPSAVVAAAAPTDKPDSPPTSQDVLQPTPTTQLQEDETSTSVVPDPTTLVVDASQQVAAATQPASYQTSYYTIGHGVDATGGYVIPAGASPTADGTDILPAPTQGPPGTTQATEQSRRAAVLGTFMAIATLFSLLFCMSPDDKDIDSLLSSNVSSHLSSHVDQIVLPVLTSNGNGPSIWKNEEKPPQPQWHVISPGESGTFEDVTHILNSDEPNAITTDEMPSTRTSRAETTSSAYRTSAGTSSVAARSYITCDSHYSDASAGRTSSRLDVRASFPGATPSVSAAAIVAGTMPYKLASIRPLVTRPRSKTVNDRTHTRSSSFFSPLPPSGLSSSKSFPTLSSAFRARLSGEDLDFVDKDCWSRSSRGTQGSEWDVVGTYGRFSKETRRSDVGVAGMLSTIKEGEDEDESEAVEVSGKKCLLVKPVY